MKNGFRLRLTRRQDKVGSLLCVGLDPTPEEIPFDVIKKGFFYRDVAIAYKNWMKEAVKASALYACMYKIQSANWEALVGGRSAMKSLVAYIKLNYPDIPILLDCKRGDTGKTQGQYRRAHFTLDGVDGMNFNPYMGEDCLSALVDDRHIHRALVGLCRTSNPKAWDIQDILLPDGRRLYEYIAEISLKWFKEFGVVENAGLVMGAAHETKELLMCSHWTHEQLPDGDVYTEHLKKVRDIVGSSLWLLIPAVGAQGGNALQTVRASWAGIGSIAVNSSSAISNASREKGWQDAVTAVAKKTRDDLNSGIPLY